MARRYCSEYSNIDKMAHFLKAKKTKTYLKLKHARIVTSEKNKDALLAVFLFFVIAFLRAFLENVYASCNVAHSMEI